MVRVRVAGGTRSTTESSLCNNCVHATIIKGMGENEQIVKCGDIGRAMTFNVETCNSYLAFGQQTLYEMRQIATVIELKGQQVGFYSAKAWRKKSGDDVEIPGYDD